MAWIESHQELARHPKTKRLARKLDTSIPAIIGHLHLFWWWSMDYAQDGDLSSYDEEDIADAMMWEGSPRDLVGALIDVGFLDNDEGLHIHDWYDYAGRLMEQRKFQNARSKRKRDLYDNSELTSSVRKRDGDCCRYCGKVVNWKDRKSPDGGTYDHIDPEGKNSIENIVVACRGCNSRKGRRTPEVAGMHLLPIGRYSADIQQIIYQDQQIISAIPNITIPNITIPNLTKEEKHMSACADEHTKTETETFGGQETGGAQSTTGIGLQAPAEKPEAYTSEFEKFWSFYPRRIEKKSAYKAWQARIRDGTSTDDMITAAKNYGAYCLKRGTDAGYIKHASSFLGPTKAFEDYIRGFPDAGQPSSEPKSWQALQNVAKRVIGGDFLDG